MAAARGTLISDSGPIIGRYIRHLMSLLVYFISLCGKCQFTNMYCLIMLLSGVDIHVYSIAWPHLVSLW